MDIHSYTMKDESKIKEIFLSYPPVIINGEVNQKYPLLKKLREIVKKIENKETRESAISEYESLF